MKIKHVFLPAIFSLLSPLYTNAATYTVTNTNNSGPSSLREAIATANSTTADDQIVFNISGCPSGVCTIVLSSELVVSSSSSSGALTISNPSGPGNLIISGNGNNATRIFNAIDGSNLTLEGLTMKDGVSFFGGAIHNIGSLTVSNSVIRNNVGDYAGGGIFNSGVLVIVKSEISGNLALGGPFPESYGGGIYSVAGTVLIRDSTISGNSAQVAGGGLQLGGPYQPNSLTAVIVNSTISGNRASYGGGICVVLENSSSVRITNSTITMNTSQANDSSGGAVGGSGSSMFARNSIIAGNTAANFPDIDDRFLIFNNLGNNLIGGSPLLGPLANNGGPTRTHALLAGSPAIDAGNSCVLTANGCGDGNLALVGDQRGFGRSGPVDIGAFELTMPGAVFDITGRVTTSAGLAVRGARVVLEDGAGHQRFALTNPFGYFRFQDAAAGTYTVTARSKRYGSASTTITVSSSITNLELVL